MRCPPASATRSRTQALASARHVGEDTCSLNATAPAPRPLRGRESAGRSAGVLAKTPGYPAAQRDRGFARSTTTWPADMVLTVGVMPTVSDPGGRDVARGGTARRRRLVVTRWSSGPRSRWLPDREATAAAALRGPHAGGVRAVARGHARPYRPRPQSVRGSAWTDLLR